MALHSQFGYEDDPMIDANASPRHTVSLAISGNSFYFHGPKYRIGSVTAISSQLDAANSSLYAGFGSPQTAVSRILPNVTIELWP